MTKLLNHLLSAKIYTVSVRVGEVVNSQTSLYIQLFGENGETSKIMLRPAGPSLSKFEPGRTYKFTVETVDIGKVCPDLIRQINLLKQVGTRITASERPLCSLFDSVVLKKLN